MNPRLSVNGYPFKENPLETDLAYFAAAGFPAIGLWEQKVATTGWARTAELLATHRLRLEYLVKVSMFTLDQPGGWQAERATMIELLDNAARLGVPSVYGTTGPAGGLVYEAAAEAFVEAATPVAEHALRSGVRLLVEQQNPLGQGASFVSTFRDLVELASAADLGICLDLFHAWREGGLIANFRSAVDRIGLVQVADYAVGTRQLGDRAVPGDGIVPLEDLIGAMVAAGYQGVFDLEITGPRIEAEGREAASRRGAERLSALLDRLPTGSRS